MNENSADMLVGTILEKDPIEKKILDAENGVKEAMKRIDELPDVQFLPGQEERVGIFPMFENDPEIPVLARFSYGLKAPNMSAVFFDKAKGETPEQGAKNTQDFLAEQGFEGRVIQILGKFIPTDEEIKSGKYSPAEAQIEEVDLDTKKDKIFGNVVFTRDENVVLTIKPADCDVFVFSGQDNKGNNITGIIHVGRDATIAGFVRQGLTYLQDEIGVDLSKLKIVGFPGASRKNYWISNQAERRATGISIYNLGEDNIDEVDKTLTTDEERNAQKRHVDLLSAGEMQAVQAGVLPENIQVCRADTYDDAGKDRTYSRRWSDEHDGVHPGGNLVAVQLKKVA
jgi:copper oxidase (laccase) domain-containing protein